MPQQTKRIKQKRGDAESKELGSNMIKKSRSQPPIPQDGIGVRF